MDQVKHRESSRRRWGRAVGGRRSAPLYMYCVYSVLPRYGVLWTTTVRSRLTIPCSVAVSAHGDEHPAARAGLARTGLNGAPCGVTATVQCSTCVAGIQMFLQPSGPISGVVSLWDAILVSYSRRNRHL